MLQKTDRSCNKWQLNYNNLSDIKRIEKGYDAKIKELEKKVDKSETTLQHELEKKVNKIKTSTQQKNDALLERSLAIAEENKENKNVLSIETCLGLTVCSWWMT